MTSLLVSSDRLYKYTSFLFIAYFLLALPAAVATEPDPFHVTGLPLPRFASLGAGEANLRTGPGTHYPVRVVYRQKGLPVEIILEYDHWRKVRDADGTKGWVHKALLSGRRMAITTQAAVLRRTPSPDGRAAARVEPGALLHLDACEEGWCRAEAGGYSGWVDKASLWGVYAGEVFG
ncbi:MAG TPA: hypothetical protein DDX54_04630 [Rhodospirillaceae bacterium]|jgi:SH3-like domain-containing protein|nr:SH3 domain-containing protein [Alphaproteobacteria bacterium]HBH26666.1 hypothetical protein [Rhodospirillaceae bacterium]